MATGTMSSEEALQVNQEVVLRLKAEYNRKGETATIEEYNALQRALSAHNKANAERTSDNLGHALAAASKAEECFQESLARTEKAKAEATATPPRPRSAEPQPALVPKPRQTAGLSISDIPSSVRLEPEPPKKRDGLAWLVAIICGLIGLGIGYVLFALSSDILWDPLAWAFVPVTGFLGFFVGGSIADAMLSRRTNRRRY